MKEEREFALEDTDTAKKKAVKELKDQIDKTAELLDIINPRLARDAKAKNATKR